MVPKTISHLPRVTYFVTSEISDDDMLVFGAMSEMMLCQRDTL